MRRSTLSTLLAAPLAVFVLACGSGSSGTTTEAGGTSGAKAAGAPAGPVTVAAGTVMTLTEQVLTTKTVVDVTLTNVKYGVKSGNQFVKPGKGQFITADVTAVVKEGKYSIHSSMFKLVAADGTAYDSTTMLNQQDLAGNDLTVGQKTSGVVVFDAAKGAQTGAKIALKSWLAEGDAGYWTL